MNYDHSKIYGTENEAYIGLRAAQSALTMALNTARMNDNLILLEELGHPDELGVFKYGDKWVVR